MWKLKLNFLIEVKGSAVLPSVSAGLDRTAFSLTYIFMCLVIEEPQRQCLGDLEDRREATVIL